MESIGAVHYYLCVYSLARFSFYFSSLFISYVAPSHSLPCFMKFHSLLSTSAVRPLFGQGRPGIFIEQKSQSLPLSHAHL